MEKVKDFNNNDLVPNSNFEVELTENLRIYCISVDIKDDKLHMSFVYNENNNIMDDVFYLINNKTINEVPIAIYNRTAEKLINRIIVECENFKLENMHLNCREGYAMFINVVADIKNIKLGLGGI